MKKTLLFRRIFAAVLLLTVSSISWANGTKINGIYYVLDSSSKTASVTYTGTTSDYNPSSTAYTGSITIPSTVTYKSITYSVTSIGEYAFRSCYSLTSVTIGNSVTSIGDYAFFLCIDLKSITIPNSVTSIGSRAFEDCRGLTSINIPNSVTSIGPQTFCNCSGLTSVTIPNSVTSIGDFAFSGCSGLTSVTIPNSVTSIGECAFYECSSLTSVTIPNSVTSIGEYAFSSYTLTSIIIDESNPIYDSRDNCNAIIETSSNTLITGCQSTVIPNSVTSIGSLAFYSCRGLTSITIPNSVTNIARMAFYGCSGLTSVTIPNSVTSIGSSAFSNCSGLTSITIPNSVTNIARMAFYGCSGLTSVTIPNSVTSIGSSAFSNCSGLTSITIGNNVTSIGNNAFYNCSSLTSVTINSNNLISKTYTSSSNIKTLFGSQVKEYILGDYVTSIGDYAFYGCSDLLSITIPISVTSIGDRAFSYCSSLSKFFCYAENVPSTESELIFNETPINSAKLYVPNGSLELYKVLSPWKDFEKVLPNNTTIYYIVDGEIYKQYKIEADTPITPEPIPTKEGYTFSGWSEIPGTMPANDVTVTGTFSVNNYTLTYLLNGEPYLTKTIAYGTPLELEPTLKREGYTFTGWSEIPETMPANDVIIRGAFYINGDVNTDNEVDVVDVVDIARFVVGTPAITFMEVLADINKDGTVNIGDAVVLVNDIVGNQNFVRRRLVPDIYASNNMLTLTRRNGDLSLNLKNESYYAAFQFDLYVPEDIEVSRIMLNSERKNYHQLLYNKIEDGHYRIAVMSKVNNIFNGHDGELLNITLDEIPDNEISIRNILFFDSEGQSYQFDDMESTITTQIEELSSTISKEKWVIYDLRARKSEKLQRGVNIVNGKKILY